MEKNNNRSYVEAWDSSKSSGSSQVSHLEAALRYLAKGWSIIPIRPNDKKPYLSSWLEYQKRHPSVDEVKEWWTLHPIAGIGLVCGKISGVIVVDIDVKDGQPKHTLKLTPSLSAKSGGGGSHVFYKWREGLVGARVGIQQGVDIRSDASYIILAPSLHPSGNRYEWITDENEPLAPAPVWLEAASSNEDHERNDWQEFLSSQKGPGIRNMSATKVAGKILYDMSPDVWDTLGWSAFKGWNKEFNNPPLPDKELISVWESIKKTHVKNSKAPESESVDFPVSPDGTASSNEDGAPQRSPESADSEEEKQILKNFLKDKTSGTFYLATYITRKFSIVTVGEAEREMYVYRDGMYKRAENEVIYPEIQRILGRHVTKNAKNETFHKIADMTSYPRDIFSSAHPRYIPLKNGVYDFETLKLLPHDPSYRFTYQFPIIYRPDEKCPKTEAFLDQVLTKDQRTIVEEWMGYYFWRIYQFKKAIIFVGEGDTGKTTLLETIIHMVGKENTSGVSLQKMTSDKFSAAQLYEKHANIVDELSAKDISDTGQFKMATGGGNIMGEYKFGNQFAFKNFSKLTFACNRIPDVKDFDDEAYFNRWMVIRFQNPIVKKIPNFIATLTTEEERSGLFNLAMEGLRRLLANGGFSSGASAMDTKREMMRSGSSIAMFAADRIGQDAGYEISKEAMYDAYVNYCNENGLAVETIKMFGSKLSFYAPYAADGLITDIASPGRTKRVRGWRNVKIVKTEAESLIDSASDRDMESLAVSSATSS